MVNFKSKEKNLTLLTGIVEREPNFKIRNRLQSFGEIEGLYDKVKLVPFGEFIPLERYLGKLLDIIGLNLTNTVPGEEIKMLSSSKLRISPSICYEIAFDNIVRKTAFDSNILITVSNDTWFGRSIGPEQHLEIAQNRALEHKKPLLRATNSGVSAIISHNGQVIEKQGYFEEKPLKGSIFLFMFLEALAYSMVLGIVLHFMVRLVLLSAGGFAGNALQNIALSLGAGLFEEFFFRVLLLNVLFWGLKFILRTTLLTGLVAILTASLLFSLSHYIGNMADTFQWYSFIFRWMAGLLFTLLYFFRGFAITAYTHALYDIQVLL